MADEDLEIEKSGVWERVCESLRGFAERAEGENGKREESEHR
jgi:hypothetical protein